VTTGTPIEVDDLLYEAAALLEVLSSAAAGTGYVASTETGLGMVLLIQHIDNRIEAARRLLGFPDTDTDQDRDACTYSPTRAGERAATKCL
jgi:hypothetical protein